MLKLQKGEKKIMKLFTKYVLFLFAFVVVSQANIPSLSSPYDLKLYDYGARYYDPRTSVWQSPDPILDTYMNGQANGGIYNPHNLKLYTYTYNNPVNLSDPNGEIGIFGAFVGAIAGVVVQGALDAYNGELSGAGAYVGAATGGAIVGATAGMGSGAAAGFIATGSGAVGGATASVTQAIVDGEEISAGNVAEGAAYGAVGGAVGHKVGQVVKSSLDKLPNSVKGKIGETVTKIKYGAKGYKRSGEARILTGGLTPTGRRAAARYDNAMKNVITGKELTVESKFNTAGLTKNQKAAKNRVTTPGGLIVDRTTSDQLGGISDAAVRGASTGGAE